MVEQIRTFCEFPFRHIKFDSEGNATMCCLQVRGCLGNIFEKNLEELWNSDLAKEIRNYTANDSLHTMCSNSGVCPFIHQQAQLQDLHFDSIWPPMPDQLELDLPNQHCNIGGLEPSDDNPACLMCERHLNFFPQNDRLDEICERLRPYILNFAVAHVQGIAEPFWKNRIFQLLETLGVHPNTQITTFTNGTLFTGDKRDRWLAILKSTLSFSIDAATPETYRKIRRIDAYDKVVDHLLEYSEMRGPEQYLNIHNNINLLNVDEVVGMVELAARANVDYLDFNPTYNAPNICVNKSNAHIFHKAQQEILQRAKELNITVAFIRPLALHFCDSEVMTPFAAVTSKTIDQSDPNPTASISSKTDRAFRILQ
jgi:hypothetical protein